MLSIADGFFRELTREAKDRGVNVQILLRAVIIPEWTRSSLGAGSHAVDTSAQQTNANNEKIEAPIIPAARLATTMHREVDSYRSLYFRHLRR